MEIKKSPNGGRQIIQKKYTALSRASPAKLLTEKNRNYNTQHNERRSGLLKNNTPYTPGKKQPYSFKRFPNKMPNDMFRK